MAAELITPVDQFSGIPLPLVPREPLPSNDPEFANWNHAWHPMSAPELQSLGGKALRSSRLQLVRATDHNLGDRTRGKLTYHDYYIGPELVDDPAEQFKICVYSAAGYIPEQAISLDGDEPHLERLSREQLAILRQPAVPRYMAAREYPYLRQQASRAYARQTNPNRTKSAFVIQFIANYQAQQTRQAGFNMHHLIYRYEPVRDFFRDYVISQDLSHIRESRVEEFLQTQDQTRKMHLGHWLIAEAVQVTVDPLEQSYRQSWQRGKLHPRMPKGAYQLVLHKLGTLDDRSRLVKMYETALLSRLDRVA